MIEQVESKSAGLRPLREVAKDWAKEKLELFLGRSCDGITKDDITLEAFPHLGTSEGVANMHSLVDLMNGVSSQTTANKGI